MAPQVALVQMPFAAVIYPSLGLSLLKAGLEKADIPTRIHYLNLWFAEMVQPGFYYNMMNGRPRPHDLVGEWVFSAALWGRDPVRDEAFWAEVMNGGSSDEEYWTEGVGVTRDGFRKHARACRAKVEPFLERCLRDVPWEQYRIVGFTSMFQQQLASLVLARRLKERFPHLFIMFGGANCEAEMGESLLRNFPFVDAVCSGEGDVTVAQLVQRVLGGQSIGYLPGVRHRQGPGELPDDLRDLLASQPLPSSVVEDLNALPYPAYDDYFEQVGQCRIPPGPRQRLMFETSRGCWWGQKSHCTFCGLNGSTMGFRYKSAERVIDEIQSLLDRYGRHTRYFFATDNIMPYEYFRTLLPIIEKLDLDLDIFYETKANLTKDQISLYKRAGLVEIQPGIESLSTPVLSLMKKGTTAIQNIYLLRLCRQYGIRPAWNILYGFPGERPEHYRNLDEVIRSLTHLPPPNRWGPIRFDRFSPYLNNSGEFGLRNLRPYPTYSHIYPGLDSQSLYDIAYYFTAEFDGQESISDYTAHLQEPLLDWRRHGSDHALFSINIAEWTVICDVRTGDQPVLTAVTGSLRVIYEACDEIRSRTTLCKVVAEHEGRAITAGELVDLLDPLLEKRLLYQEGDRYVALGVPVGYGYKPSDTAVRKLLFTVSEWRANCTAGSRDLGFPAYILDRVDDFLRSSVSG